MEKSQFLGLNLPSRDNDVDIADINVLSNNFNVLDIFCGKTIPAMLQGVGDEFVEVTDELDDRISVLEDKYAQLVPDQAYNPESEKAQSGKAVAQAVADLRFELQGGINDISALVGGAE